MNLDRPQFEYLMDGFISAIWKMFICNVIVVVVGVFVVVLVFYSTTSKIIHKLDGIKISASGNTVSIGSPVTREDSIQQVLKRRGEIE